MRTTCSARRVTVARGFVAAASTVTACAWVLHACSEYDASLLHTSDAGIDASSETPLLPETTTEEGPEAQDDMAAETAEDAVTEDAGSPCSATQVDCDGDLGNGCEANLTTDGANCGACGHDCLGGGCKDARCLPVTLASGQSVPSVLAIDDSFVYWTNQIDNGALMRIAKKGGTPEVVATGALPPGGVAVDATSIYWSEFGSGGSVWKLDKSGVGDGGTPIALANGQATSGSVALDSDHVYWTTPGTIRRVLKSGGPVDTLASSQLQPGGLVAELGWVFWTNIGGGTVVGQDFVDGGIHVIAAGQNYPVGLAADFGNLYWANYLPDQDGGAPRVMSIAKANQTVPVVLADQQSGPLAVAQFGLHVYWTNNVSGTIMRVPKVGGTVETLATGQGAPAGMAVDATAVYWVNRDDGTVMALRKD